MRCPKCDRELRVLETRVVAGNMARRRRVCESTSCGLKYTTIESIVETGAKNNRAVVLVLPRHVARLVREAIELLTKTFELPQELASEQQGTDTEQPE